MYTETPGELFLRGNYILLFSASISVCAWTRSRTGACCCKRSGAMILFFNSRKLDVYIRKLRTCFATDKGIRIITLKGQGYLFTCTE